MNFFGKLQPGCMKELYIHVLCTSIIFHRIVHVWVGGVVSYCYCVSCYRALYVEPIPLGGIYILYVYACTSDLCIM